MTPRARTVRTVEDALRLLDELFDATADRWSEAAGAAWWDAFYADRSRSVPFFTDAPDENLVALLDAIPPVRRALDLGCGAGRNAFFLAERGATVDAVDLSPSAIAWAHERSIHHEAPTRFVQGDAFGPATGPMLAGPYELVYDSGCLHHLPPHRRIAYLDLLDRVLAPGGHLALVCFAAGKMGTTALDVDLYLRGGLEGGLAFTPDDLRWIFSDLELVEIRPMRKCAPESGRFGTDVMLTALFRRR